jgi:hypothetical protein
MQVLVDFDNYCWVDLAGCMATRSSFSIFANLLGHSCPPTPKFKKDTLSPSAGNFHVNVQLKQHVVDLETISLIGKAKDPLDGATRKASIVKVNKLIMKKDIKKELKLADDHVEVEEEVDKVGDNNTCEDSLSHSKCKDDDQVDSEDHNVVNLPLT